MTTDQAEKVIAEELAEALALFQKQIIAVKRLFDEGSTIPFISRYRKEQSGGLDEVQLRDIRDGWNRLEEREKRREYILDQISSQEKLTPELEKAILSAKDLQTLEDIYLPFKPKRETRASKAKKAGLEPLALEIFKQENNAWKATVSSFVTEGYETEERVLEGARDIIAELVNEDASTRAQMRECFEREALLTSKKNKENQKFQDYYDFSQPIKDLPSHRILALFRGKNEGALKLKLGPQEESALDLLKQIHFRGEQMVELVLGDCYKRLMQPSLENEFISKLKEAADQDSISVFSDNVRELLLESPLGEKRVLAIDPGFRTGCKVVVLDETGKLLVDTVIYPVEPKNDKEGAARTITGLVEKYRVEAIAIGNGTAGRETESFIRTLGLKNLFVVSVNESGASVYSASEVARREFPDRDVTVRGAVSIGRRLKDPLSELVKIDPRSIGVGQYQHDVDQKQLKTSLDDVVIECVNRVGVDLNLASRELLSYVSGLNSKIAENIIEYRNELGSFESRSQLKKVKGLGPKAFEQAAGFLRIRRAKNPLDSSAVHPERYNIVKEFEAQLNMQISEIIGNARALYKLNLKQFVRKDLGLPTLQDIKEELLKPGRDPRAEYASIEFDESLNSIEDLKEGMILQGIVTNVTQFGAFVDLGVHQDGLVHISQLSNEFISDPRTVVKVRQFVRVKVISVDVERKRIGLSMKQVR